MASEVARGVRKRSARWGRWAQQTRSAPSVLTHVPSYSSRENVATLLPATDACDTAVLSSVLVVWAVGWEYEAFR